MLRTIFIALSLAGAAHAQYSNGRQSILLELPTQSQRASVSQRVGLTDVTITYSRPLVNKRKIFGDVVKQGDVWRAGANENTVFEVTDPVTVEGQPLAAGKYGLHMIPGADSWTVIFSRNSTSWGSFSYDKAEDALRVDVKPRAAEFREALTYEFNAPKADSVELSLVWDKVAVPVRIAADVNTVAEASLKRQLRNLIGYSWQAWDDAAEWLLDNKHDLETGLKWADQSIQSAPPQFHNQQTKARILTALGRNDEASKAMQAALQVAGPIQMYNYARQLQMQNRHADAIPVFREVAKRFSGQWVAHMAQARVLSSESNFVAATKEARLALTDAPPPQKGPIEAHIAKLEKGQDINQ
jgi:tetratricopeptide (TPR) repeat protein